MKDSGMKIMAKDVVFKTSDGTDMTLVEFSVKLMDILQKLNSEWSDPKQIHIIDDDGEKLTLNDTMWGCINAIEDLNDRLSALEARKTNKLN